MSLTGQNQRGDWQKMILVAVEALPVGSKPPAAVSVRISTGENHGFGTAAPLSTKTSSLRVRAGGSTFMPNCSNLSGRLGPFLQNIYPHFPLDLLQRPPYACES